MPYLSVINLCIGQNQDRLPSVEFSKDLRSHITEAVLKLSCQEKNH